MSGREEEEEEEEMRTHMMRLCTRSFLKNEEERERERRRKKNTSKAKDEGQRRVYVHRNIIAHFSSWSSNHHLLFSSFVSNFKRRKVWYEMQHFYHLLHRQQPKTIWSVKEIDFSHTYIHIFWQSNVFDFHLYMNIHTYIYVHTNIRTHAVTIPLFLCGGKK